MKFSFYIYITNVLYCVLKPIKIQYYHQNIFLWPNYHFKEKPITATKLKIIL